MENPPKRILVVEDHADTRDVTAMTLRHNGYFVATASTATEALELCENECFDLLLGDIGLPDGSGLELMKELSAKCQIKGVAYTGYGYEKDIASARAAGFSAHLLKPADVTKMLQTIARVLEE